MKFDLDDFEYTAVDVYRGGQVKVIRLSAHVHKDRWAIALYHEHFVIAMIEDDGKYRTVPGIACHTLDDALAVVGDLYDGIPSFKKCIDSGRISFKKDQGKMLGKLLSAVMDDDRVCHGVLREDARRLLDVIEKGRSS